MTKISLRLFLAVGMMCVLSVNAYAQSNWVDFVDERTRLMFDTNDDEEKDMVVGDVDNDGDDDIVVVRKRPFSVDGERFNLLLINENGNLVDRTMEFIPTFMTVQDNARDVQFFDSDNDGWLDMIVGNTFGSLHRLYINQGNDVNGDWQGYADQGTIGQWYSPPLSTTPQCCGVATGDVDGDGFDDIYFVDYNNNLEAHLFMNNQDNTYTNESSRLSSAARNQAFGTTGFLADMNGDTHLDIVSNDSVAFGGVGVEIAYNDGNGFFMQTQVMPSSASYMVAPADFNNDGRMDMYVVDDGQDRILLNNSTNGNGTINVTEVLHTNATLTQGFNGNIIAADMDNDGWVDMVVSDVDVDIPGCDRRFSLMRNNAGNNLFDPNNNNLQPWNMQGSHDTVVIDINRDGHLDLFMATCDNYHMFVNDAPIVLGDVDMNGVVNLLDVGPFVELLSTGGFVLQADINMDGVVNLLDVGGFVAILSNGN